VGIHTPWISHLRFANDYLVFTQASNRGANRLWGLLLTYHRGSSQMVNMAKSAFCFSANCEDSVKDSVK
jgi:hypothetical protein